MFQVPETVRIIGTMNTADRSIALVDHALRRRFAFLPLYPSYEILEQFHKDSEFSPERLVAVLKRLNDAIGNEHYQVGMSFFLCEDLEDSLQDIWETEIEPYLEEYFFDRPKKVDEFRWSQISADLES